jgi:Alginate O-acetyl transferase AlgF
VKSLLSNPFRLSAIVFVGALLIVATGAFAQFLYDPEPPADSAFVRAFTTDSLEIKIGERALGTVAAVTASAYVVIPQGARVVIAGGKSNNVTFKSGSFYTLVFNDSSKPNVIQDVVSSNRTKANLTLYNLGKTDADLKTADGKIPVIATVKPGASNSREVNAIKIAFGAFSLGKLVQAFPETQLERGAAYSAFLLEQKAVWLQNKTDKTVK